MKYFVALTLLIQSTFSWASEIHVAVAANFTSPMEEIARAFTIESGHKVVASYGSSGKLYAHVLNGAPYEIFLSADQTHPQKLVEKNKALKESVFTYAVGKLVLWSPKNNFIDSKGEVLNKIEFRHISLANPKLAPYGTAAQEVLEKMNLWQKLQSKIVLGENINQAYQFVKSGNAELGFVAYSQIIKDAKTFGSLWIVPQNYYSQIKQDAVFLKKDKSSVAAQEFMTFLKSEKAKSIIESFGYDLK